MAKQVVALNDLPDDFGTILMILVQKLNITVEEVKTQVRRIVNMSKTLALTQEKCVTDTLRMQIG